MRSPFVLTFTLKVSNLKISFIFIFIGSLTFAGLCEELVEVVQGALDINPFDLPLKRRKVTLPVNPIDERQQSHQSQSTSYPTPEEKRKDATIEAVRFSFLLWAVANDHCNYANGARRQQTGFLTMANRSLI